MTTVDQTDVDRELDPSVEHFRELTLAKAKKARWSILTVTASQVLIVAGFLGLWQLVLELGIANPLFVGTPADVLTSFWQNTMNGKFVEAAGPTFLAVAIAFATASLVGILLGVIMDESAYLDRVLQPLIALMNSVPRIALAPMMIVWFGLGTTSKAVLAFSLVVFIQFVATSSALKNVDEYLLMLSKSLGCSRWQTFLNIKLPWAMPGIFGGFRLGIVYAVLSVVVSEMIASPNGLGQLIAFYSNTFAISDALAALLFLSVVTLVLVQVINAVEKRIGTWQ